MLWRRCSNVEATSWQRWRATLSQRRKLTSVQLSFLTVPQRCDNVNNDVVTTLSRRRCASWEGYIQNIALFPLLEVMLNASISFTITFLLTVVQRNESGFLLCFIIHSPPTFLSHSVSHINNSSKILNNLTKFATKKHTSLQPALNI